jgi:hypothetical protein
MAGSNKITDNVQLIFIRDIDNAFHIDEALLIYAALKALLMAKLFSLNLKVITCFRDRGRGKLTTVTMAAEIRTAPRPV